MPMAGFEPTITASEWPQTQALDHEPSGISTILIYVLILRQLLYSVASVLCFYSFYELHFLKTQSSDKVYGPKRT